MESTTTTTPTLSFLSLPGEIRNQIYEYLLVSPVHPSDPPHVLRAHRSSNAAPPTSGTKPLLSSSPPPLSSSAPPPTVLFGASTPRIPALVHPAILCTSRTINAEASPLLYGRNTFTAHPSLLTSLPCLIDSTRPLLRPRLAHISRWHIKVRLDVDPRFTAAEVEKAFGGCEELTIEATEAMWRAAGVGVLMVFEGVRGVGKAELMGSVERTFADWLMARIMLPAGDMGVALEEWRRQMDGEVEGIGQAMRGTPGVLATVDWNPWQHGNR